MNVLMICGALPPDKCGVGDYTHELANSLVNESIHVTMLTTKGHRPGNAKYEIHDIINNWVDFSSLNSVKNELIKNNYDIVHFQHPFAGLKRESITTSIFLPLILRKHSSRLIYTLHEYSGSGWKRKARKLENRIAIRKSDAIIVVEPRFKEEIKWLKDENQIFFSQIHASIPKCCIDKRIIERRRNIILGKEEHKTIIAFFGFLASNKRMDIVLEAMKKLKYEGRLNSKLAIFTSIDDENSYHHLFKKTVKEFGLDNDVFYTGYLSAEDASEYLAASDFGILLYSEGVSVRHSAALALLKQGTKLITTYPHKGEDFHFNGIQKDQIRFTHNNADELAEIIFEEQNVNQKYNTAEDIFEAKHTAHDYIDIYKSLMGDSQSENV